MSGGSGRVLSKGAPFSDTGPVSFFPCCKHNTPGVERNFMPCVCECKSRPRCRHRFSCPTPPPRLNANQSPYSLCTPNNPPKEPHLGPCASALGDRRFGKIIVAHN